MRTIKGQILATTALDADNERIPKEILYSFFRSMPSEQTMGQEHDMSKKPTGKIYNKGFKELESGESAIIADIDIYDEEAFKKYKGFSISYTTERLSVYPDKQPEIELFFNPKYFENESVLEIVHLSTEKISIDGRVLKQKGLETAAILIIKFIGFSIAAGFFGKAGSDFYDTIKQKLKKISDERKVIKNDETKLNFQYTYKNQTSEYKVLIELTADHLKLASEKNILLESAHTFIENKVGSSNILSVVIRMIDFEPFWEILYFTDKNGKYISL